MMSSYPITASFLLNHSPPYSLSTSVHHTVSVPQFTIQSQYLSSPYSLSTSVHHTVSVPQFTIQSQCLSSPYSLSTSVHHPQLVMHTRTQSRLFRGFRSNNRKPSGLQCQSSREHTFLHGTLMAPLILKCPEFSMGVAMNFAPYAPTLFDCFGMVENPENI